MENENALEVREQIPVEFLNADFAEELTNVTERKTMFCSFIAETPEQKKKLFNAMNSADAKLSSMIGEKITIVDVYCETVTIINEESGEKQVAPRVVFIDKNGKSYTSTSFGIFNSLKKLIAVYGMPTWPQGVNVKVKQIERGINRIYTLEVV